MLGGGSLWVINVYESEHTTQPTQPAPSTQPPSKTTTPAKPHKSNMLYIAGAIFLALLGAGVYELSKRKR